MWFFKILKSVRSCFRVIHLIPDILSIVAIKPSSRGREALEGYCFMANSSADLLSANTFYEIVHNV